jgi:hypothetical protein
MYSINSTVMWAFDFSRSLVFIVWLNIFRTLIAKLVILSNLIAKSLVVKKLIAILLPLGLIEEKNVEKGLEI